MTTNRSFAFASAMLGTFTYYPVGSEPIDVDGRSFGRRRSKPKVILRGELKVKALKDKPVKGKKKKDRGNRGKNRKTK